VRYTLTKTTCSALCLVFLSIFAHVYAELSELLVAVRRLLTIACAVGREAFGAQFVNLESAFDDSGVDDDRDGVLLRQRVCRVVNDRWTALFENDNETTGDVASTTTNQPMTSVPNYNDDNDDVGVAVFCVVVAPVKRKTTQSEPRVERTVNKRARHSIDNNNNDETLDDIFAPLL
jgi:hypothetical protein